MAEMTGDSQWNQMDQVKTIILEHHMAAKRMGFFEMFEPLYRVDEYRTGLLDGSLPLVRFFARRTPLGYSKSAVAMSLLSPRLHERNHRS